MIKIQEVLPNPIGTDRGAEYVILFNNSTQTIQLSGWQLKDASGKVMRLDAFTVKPVGQLRLSGEQFKLTLNNSNDSLTLLNPAGTIIDSFSYNSAAAEGVPLLHNAELTPEIRAQLFDEFVPRDLPGSSAVSGGVILLALITAAILAGISVYVIKNIKPHEILDAPHN